MDSIVETYTCALALVCAVLLLQGGTANSQAAECFNSPFFGCNGDIVTVATSVDECCAMGFLAGHQAGVDTCIQCIGNVICMKEAECSEAGTLDLGPSTPEECCTNQEGLGGLAYVTFEGVCEVCHPRTPDPHLTTLPEPSHPTTTPPDSLPSGLLIGIIAGALLFVIVMVVILIIVVLVVLRNRHEPSPYVHGHVYDEVYPVPRIEPPFQLNTNNAYFRRTDTCHSARTEPAIQLNTNNAYFQRTDTCHSARTEPAIQLNTNNAYFPRTSSHHAYDYPVLARAEPEIPLNANNAYFPATDTRHAYDYVLPSDKIELKANGAYVK